MKAAFTICTNNYLAQAKILSASIHQFAKEYKFYLFLVDELHPEINYQDFPGIEFILAKTLPIEFSDLIKKYDIVELNTCIKASAFKHLFTEKGAETVHYFDPDIELFDDIKQLDTNFEQAPILLTPHIMNPIPWQEGSPNENLFLNHGLYNLGYIGINKKGDYMKLLNWWENRTLTMGFNRTRHGLFVDQLWINYVPLFFPGSTKILFDQGYNMGPWNLHERSLSNKEDRFFVNDQVSLKFYHFSSYKYNQHEISGNYRYTFASNPDVRSLYDLYQQKMIDAVRKYYSKKEEGLFVNPVSIPFLFLYLNRFFLIFLSLFRWDKNPYSKYINSNSVKDFLLRLLGFYTLRNAKAELQNNYEPLAFQNFSNPVVSIIISSSNPFIYTYNCLRSILENTAGIAYEIILITDDVTNQNDQFLASTSIIRIRKDQKANLTVLQNRAAEIANGEFLCFLDHRTLLNDQWLKNMLSVFDYDPETGVVCPKFIYSYGLLKAAGNVINVHGEEVNYGRYDDAEQFDYNYIKETGFGSSACLLVKKTTFNQAGKFSSGYDVRFYIDADFCYTVKTNLNKKIYYQPLTHIVHFEGLVSGQPKSQKGSQTTLSKQHFIQKWNTILMPPPESIKERKDQKSILIIDATLPKPDQDSGSKRLFELIKLFQSINLQVYFLAHQGLRVDPYYSNLVNIGIRVIYSRYPKEKLVKKIPDLLPSIDLAWISRPDINQIYGPAIQAIKLIPWIYDTVDLHFIRLQRAFELSDMDPIKIEEKIKPIRALELRLANLASHTITVTDVEKQILIKNKIKNVSVIPNVHAKLITDKDNPGFEERKDLVFIGSYAHEPNIDAAVWLAKEIMPLVWNTNPEIKLLLLGSKPTPEVLALTSDRIDVPGFIHDVEPYFINSRVFVAPLRYGAGMKGKIGQSLEYGLPIVSTKIGIEGMPLIDGQNVLVGETAIEFAAKIIELYKSPELWYKIQRNSILALEEYTPENVATKLKDLLKELTLN
eukprot:gene15393-18596_t